MFDEVAKGIVEESRGSHTTDLSFHPLGIEGSKDYLDAPRWGRRYPWARWLKKGVFTLHRHTDYDGSTHGMAQQCRNAARRHKVWVSITIATDGNSFTVKVTPRGPGNTKPPSIEQRGPRPNQEDTAPEPIPKPAPGPKTKGSGSRKKGKGKDRRSR